MHLSQGFAGLAVLACLVSSDVLTAQCPPSGSPGAGDVDRDSQPKPELTVGKFRLRWKPGDAKGGVPDSSGGVPDGARTGPRPLPGATPRGPTTPRGVAMVFERSAASTDALKIYWKFPVPEPDAQAMAFRRAITAIAGDDPRPLIVLRECWVCDDPENALLRRNDSNETTRIMTRWFHCVQLPDSVRDPAHPFHGLFEDDLPPHLFVCDRDGKNVVTFDGTQLPSKMHQAIFKQLRLSYSHDARVAIKKIRRSLEDFDRIDTKRVNCRDRYDRELEKNGRTALCEKLETQRQQLDDEIKKLERKIELISNLGLKKSAARVAGK